MTTSLTLAVFLGFVVGKPVGIFLFSWVAVKLRIASLPMDLTWRMVLGGGMLAGIGFTMALTAQTRLMRQNWASWLHPFFLLFWVSCC